MTNAYVWGRKAVYSQAVYRLQPGGYAQALTIHLKRSAAGSNGDQA